MSFNAEIIIRTVRGVLGAALIIMGIMGNIWIALPGALILMSAITGSCGPGRNCNVKYTQKQEQ